MSVKKITMLEACNYAINNGDRLLSVEDVANAIGVKPGTLLVYNSRASRERLGPVESRSGLPQPDFRFGRSPIWLESTISAWRGTFVKFSSRNPEKD